MYILMHNIFYEDETKPEFFILYTYDLRELLYTPAYEDDLNDKDNIETFSASYNISIGISNNKIRQYNPYIYFKHTSIKLQK